MSPQRIQQKRTKGWRMPLNAKSVARPSKWGNPFRVQKSKVWIGDWKLTGPEPTLFIGHYSTKEAAARVAVEMYALHAGPMGYYEIDQESLSELRGLDLACRCPLDQPCHADVLLELANEPP